ncbi:glycosyltransferase family 39 protein [Candidatus Woesearchaeota archaeon]|nr:glycosyltransferase family 39 protein [Candidatus Woesearchaeota archaeon]
MLFKKFSKFQLIVIAALLTSLIMQILIGMFHNSVVWDELCFVGQGRAILSTLSTKYSIFSDHPPLSYYLNSLFLLPLKFDKNILQGGDGNKLCWQIGHDILFNSGYNTNLILLLSRLPFIILSVILGAYVLKWATELFGAKSGTLALFLYSFNPSIIAYSGLATTDFAVAAMMFISIYYFWKFANNRFQKNVVMCGLFFALAMLSKETAIILLPLFLLIGIFAAYRHKLDLRIFLKRFVIIILIAFFVMWPFYLFQFGTIYDHLMPKYFSEKAREKIINIPLVSKPVLFAYERIKMPMPSLVGMYIYLPYQAVQEKSNFVFGRITEKNVWYMGLLTLSLKTHLSLLIILIMLVYFWRKKEHAKSAGVFLMLPIVLILLFFSVINKFSGVRHILVAYPLIFVLAGSIINFTIKKKFVFNLVIFLLLFSYFISAVLSQPYYLSYTTIIVGSNVQNIVVGANLDQGQDLLELKEYLKEHNINKIKLSYWGSVDPKDYGISYEYMPSPSFQPWQNNYSHIVANQTNVSEDCSERKGMVAISVTNLQNVHLFNKTCYDWLKKYEPIERIGHSIFIYDIK